MKSICKYNNIHLVRQLLDKQALSLNDTQDCLKVAMYYNCRDLVELLLGLGLDVSSFFQRDEAGYEAALGNKVPQVKLLLDHGSQVGPDILNHCEGNLKRHNYICQRDYKGKSEDVVIDYMLARHAKSADVEGCTILTRLVGDAEDSKVWSARVD
jgi:hypothetical protein